MSSRIAHHIDFPDYSVDELMRSPTLMLDHRLRFATGGAADLPRLPRAAHPAPRFANARSVRNALDRARLRQASRLLDDPRSRVGRAALTTLEAADFSGSRVFAGGAAPAARERDAAAPAPAPFSPADPVRRPARAPSASGTAAEYPGPPR